MFVTLEKNVVLSKSVCGNTGAEQNNPRGTQFILTGVYSASSLNRSEILTYLLKGWATWMQSPSYNTELHI